MTQSTSFRLYASVGLRTTWMVLFGSAIVFEKVDERDKGSMPVLDRLSINVSAGADFECFIGELDILSLGRLRNDEQSRMCGRVWTIVC